MHRPHAPLVSVLLPFVLAVGHSKGETLLPLPPLELPSADRASKDKERVHVLETAVVTWTKQIKNVLKLDPEHALKSGSHPGPMAEIEFWQAKSRHLNSIQQQLQGAGDEGARSD